MKRISWWTTCCCIGWISSLWLGGIQASKRPSPASTKAANVIKTLRIPGERAYNADFDDIVEQEESSTGSSIKGMGREYTLFENNQQPQRRGSDTVETPDMYKVQPTGQRDAPWSGGWSPFRNNNNNNYNNYNAPSTPSGLPPHVRTNRQGGRSHHHRSNFQRRHDPHQRFFQPVTDWWLANISPNVKNWPKLHCRVEPTTTLKLRKTFRPLKTIVVIGADFNTQLGVWQFKSSWEDAIIGGKLTLAGRELQISKSWPLSVGGVMEDLVTRLKFRAAVDLSTWKAYARVGFRTERLSPINVMEGFTLLKQVPLDGSKGHVKLEVKANFALPEPEIEYSTETQRSLIGMGDIEVSIEELNLLLDY
jgi:hypothetical protein